MLALSIIATSAVFVLIYIGVILIQMQTSTINLLREVNSMKSKIIAIYAKDLLTYGDYVQCSNCPNIFNNNLLGVEPNEDGLFSCPTCSKSNQPS